MDMLEELLGQLAAEEKRDIQILRTSRTGRLIILFSVVPGISLPEMPYCTGALISLQRKRVYEAAPYGLLEHVGILFAVCPGSRRRSG